MLPSVILLEACVSVFLSWLVSFMICSVNSHATPPPALGTSSCFFSWLATCHPLSQGFPCFCSRSPPPLCQGILPKKWFPYDKGSCMLVGSVGLSLVARAFPCDKGSCWHKYEELIFWQDIVCATSPSAPMPLLLWGLFFPVAPWPKIFLYWFVLVIDTSQISLTFSLLAKRNCHSCKGFLFLRRFLN